MKVLVDTNILLRRAQAISLHHQLALDALTALVSAGHEICLVLK